MCVCVFVCEHKGINMFDMNDILRFQEDALLPPKVVRYQNNSIPNKKRHTLTLTCVRIG